EMDNGGAGLVAQFYEKTLSNPTTAIKNKNSFLTIKTKNRFQMQKLMETMMKKKRTIPL
ncbi:hypothetical protein SNEBB_009978, partial [Seison nebaliae]